MWYYSPMDAVILCAGYGARLRPVTLYYQKAALGIYAVPPVLYQILNLRNQGCKRFFINMFHQKESLKGILKRFSPSGIEINIIEENEILGTGGAIYNMRDLLKGDFLVINGDSYLDIELARFYEFHESSGNLSSLMLGCRSGKDVSGIGMKDGIITDIDIDKVHDQPFMFYGCHIISSEIFGYFSKSGYSDIILDLYLSLAEDGRLGGYTVSKPLFDIGTFENIKTGLDILVRSSFKAVNIRDYAIYDAKNNSVYFGSDNIKGNIRNSTISYGVTASRGSEIINSVIMQDNHIGPGNRVVNAIVPPGFFRK